SSSNSGGGTPVTAPEIIQPGLVRSQYPNLATVLSPTAPRYIAEVSQQQGQMGYPVYVVTHVDLTDQKLIKYTIDTGVHAGLNPVIIEDSVSEERSVLYHPIF